MKDRRWTTSPRSCSIHCSRKVLLTFSIPPLPQTISERTSFLEEFSNDILGESLSSPQTSCDLSGIDDITQWPKSENTLPHPRDPNTSSALRPFLSPDDERKLFLFWHVIDKKNNQDFCVENANTLHTFCSHFFTWHFPSALSCFSLLMPSCPYVCKHQILLRLFSFQYFF